jgi:hypothetical protein
MIISVRLRLYTSNNKRDVSKLSKSTNEYLNLIPILQIDVTLLCCFGDPELGLIQPANNLNTVLIRIVMFSIVSFFLMDFLYSVHSYYYIPQRRKFSWLSELSKFFSKKPKNNFLIIILRKGIKKNNY